jgi:endo-1,4-beta-D-glucanase Y
MGIEIMKNSTKFARYTKNIKDQLGTEITDRDFDLEYFIKTNDEVSNLIKKSPEFAQAVYHSLCNVDWKKVVDDETMTIIKLKGFDTTWGCSWRYAGGIIAEVTGEGNYLDYYCSGNEGMVDDIVEEVFGKYGWIPIIDE